MFCSRCGSAIPEGVSACPNCSAPINNNQAQQSGVYYTPNQNQYNYQSDYNQSNPFQQYSNPMNDYQFQNYKNELSSSNTLGIISIILGIIFTPIVGIICGIIGLSKANSVPDMMDNPALMEEKRKAKKLNTVGIVLPVVLWLILIVLIVVIFMITGAAAVGALAYY
ncbi:MAG: hypothetical protein NC397_02600 [Clostridium sp.]|nr:hypothetical protein [Clostridium sp.]